MVRKRFLWNITYCEIICLCRYYYRALCCLSHSIPAVIIVLSLQPSGLHITRDLSQISPTLCTFPTLTCGFVDVGYFTASSFPGNLARLMALVITPRLLYTTSPRSDHSSLAQTIFYDHLTFALILSAWSSCLLVIVVCYLAFLTITHFCSLLQALQSATNRHHHKP